METGIELVNEEIRAQRALAVMQHRVLLGSTIREACHACNVPESTFYDWAASGVLSEYLADCREGRSKVASTIAAEAVPDIMHYMVKIAKGEEKRKNVSPVAAAQFVFSVAGVKKSAASTAEVKPGTPAVLAFIPQMVTFRIEHGVPVSGAPIEIIEGEAEEILEPPIHNDLDDH